MSITRSRPLSLTPLAIVFGLCLLVPSGLEAQAECRDVSGTWNLELDFQGQPVPVTLVVEQVECEIHGTLTGGQGEQAFENGAVEGAKLDFSIAFQGGGGSFTLQFSGEVDGENISGTTTTPQGSISWSGKKRG